MSELDITTLQAMSRAAGLTVGNDEYGRGYGNCTYDVRRGNDRDRETIFETNDLDQLRAFLLGWIAHGSR